MQHRPYLNIFYAVILIDIQMSESSFEIKLQAWNMSLYADVPLHQSEASSYELRRYKAKRLWLQAIG